ncbi:MAG: bacillithiol biosynthesis cysteine-adding enzyme BshC [Gemmatimonadota bacterium]
MSSVLTPTAVSQLNLELRSQRLDGPLLVRDYFDAAPALAPFFAGSPWDLASAKRVADRVRSHFDQASRLAMRDALHPTTEAARTKLERIVAGDGFFVTTGQQAGLFSGPLFTIYKALTAIKTAEALERTLSVPVAPLFWIAADDHDFAEVNHIYVIGADNNLHRLEISGGDDVPRSMQRHLLDDGVVAAVERLAATLPATDFAQSVMDWVREAYVPGRSMAEAFATLMKRLFGTFDLLITSSAHPVVKTLAAPVIAREIERSERHETAVRRQTDKLLALGYHEQVNVRAGAANVLYEDEHGRDRLVREDGSWHLSRTKRRLETTELHDLLSRFPERFSPNVLLRPVVASEVFPSIAYVGGPAEISYFGQIGCLFAAHEIPMPLVQPRMSIDIIEYKVRKVLDKFGLEVVDLRRPFDQLASQVIRDELPTNVAATMLSLREQILNGYAALMAATEAIDPTLKGPLENARNASHKALADVEKKIVSHLKKKNDVGIEQLRKASMNLYPDAHPQERTISAISYLARYGPSFIDAIAAEAEVRQDGHAPEWQGVACD